MLLFINNPPFLQSSSQRGGSRLVSDSVVELSWKFEKC